jgi:DNA-binding response OmpR family regulator
LLRREQILNNIFPLNQLDPFSSALDVHISNIRRRLCAKGKFKEKILITRHGYGYGILN